MVAFQYVFGTFLHNIAQIEHLNKLPFGWNVIAEMSFVFSN